MTTSLSPLAMFTGTFGGMSGSAGLNTIFRPAGPDGVLLEVNQLAENLTFFGNQSDLGVAVNRGGGTQDNPQADITLQPTSYFQYIEDRSIPDTPAHLKSGASIIHTELGQFIVSPATTDPDVPVTIQRLGTIAHGVSFCMQGFATTIEGPPTIPPMNCSDSVTPTGIQPFVTGSNPPQLVSMPSLVAADTTTARLPQVLPAAVTQAVLDDPNTLLRTAIAKQTILSTTILSLSTNPVAPLAGGGVTNTDFLLQNAECLQARCTFFLETVKGGLLTGGNYPQIQYTQEILLRFPGPDGVMTTFPHITNATLTRNPFPVPVVV